MLRAAARATELATWLAGAYALAVGWYVVEVAGYPEPTTPAQLLNLPHHVFVVGVLAALLIPIHIALGGVAGWIERRPVRDYFRAYEQYRETRCQS